MARFANMFFLLYTAKSHNESSYVPLACVFLKILLVLVKRNWETTPTHPQVKTLSTTNSNTETPKKRQVSV